MGERDKRRGEERLSCCCNNTIAVIIEIIKTKTILFVSFRQLFANPHVMHQRAHGDSTRSFTSFHHTLLASASSLRSPFTMLKTEEWKDKRSELASDAGHQQQQFTLSAAPILASCLASMFSSCLMFIVCCNSLHTHK